MSEQEEIKPYGLYLIGCHYEHGEHDNVFEFFKLPSQQAELEEKIAELLNKQYYPFRAKDLHVILGTEKPFMVEKAVISGVSVKV